MGGENDDVVAAEGVFGLRKALIGDDFAEGGVGGVFIGGEEGHGLVELLREGGLRVVLRLGSR